MADLTCIIICSPPKTECGCPSGGGIKIRHIRYPSYGGTQKQTKHVHAHSYDLDLMQGHCGSGEEKYSYGYITFLTGVCFFSVFKIV